MMMCEYYPQCSLAAKMLREKPPSLSHCKPHGESACCSSIVDCKVSHERFGIKNALCECIPYNPTNKGGANGK